MIILLADYIKNSLMNKKKRLEQLTQGALRASSKTVDDIWRVQTGERLAMHSDLVYAPEKHCSSTLVNFAGPIKNLVDPVYSPSLNLKDCDSPRKI